MLISKESTEILDSIPDGIALCDGAGNLLYINQAGKEILGIATKSIPKSEWSDYFGFFKADKSTPYPTEELPLVRALAGENVAAMELFARNPLIPEGKWISASAKPLKEGNFGLTGGGIAIFRDVTEEHHLELNRQHMEALIAYSNDAIFSTDLNSIVQTWNPCAERLYGYAANEIIGKSALILIPEDHLMDEPTFLARLKTGERIENFETVRMRKDGKRISVSVTVSPIKNEHGEIVSTSRIVRDITQTKAAKDELLAAKQELEDKVSDLAHSNEELKIAREQANSSSKLKSEFVANMSHEIRTPMNGIIGMCNILLKTTMDERQRNYANAISEASNSLLKIINDILDFSKIEAGKIELESVDFDPVSVVESTCEILAGASRQKKLSLMSYIEPSLPNTLVGDPERLRQVLINLTANAIKFTDKGEISVGAKVESKVGNIVNVRFSICDQGIGISPEEQRILFQPFTQADGSITRKFGGSGLGLSISKRLVSLMGGTINLQSEKGKGSTFILNIPFQYHDRITRKSRIGSIFESQELTDLHHLFNTRILVIDDEMTAQEIIRSYIHSWGMRCDITGSAEKGLKAMRKAVQEGDPYKVALVDLMMSGKNGFELAEAVNNDKDLKDIKLILHTGNDSPGLGREAARLGFKAYLIKPSRQSQILDSITGVLDEQLLIATSEDVLRLSPITAEGDSKHKTVLIAEDHPINQQVLQLYLAELGIPYDTAKNGQEALDAVLSTEYALVLMDCQMPEMDGFAATAAIRKRETRAGRRTPIIAVTAHAMEGDRERCIAAGMDDYLSKPIKPSHLRKIVEHWMPQGGAFYGNKLGFGIVPDPINIDELVTRFGPDNMIKLSTMFATQTPQAIEELEFAVKTKDMITTLKSAHSMRGSCQMVSALPMSYLCSAIETAAQTSDWNTMSDLVGQLRQEFDSIKAILRQYEEA